MAILHNGVEISKQIHTGLYSDFALEVFKDLQAYYSKTGSKQIRRVFMLCAPAKNEHGEVMLNFLEVPEGYSTWTSWHINRCKLLRNDNIKKIKMFFAKTISQFILKEIYNAPNYYKVGNNLADIKPYFDRKNEMYFGNKNYSFKDLNFLIDYLLEKKQILKKCYSNKYKANLIGKQYNPIITELYLTKDKDLHELKKDYENESQSLRLEMKNRIEAISKEYTKKLNECKQAYEQKVNEIDANYTKMIRNLSI